MMGATGASSLADADPELDAPAVLAGEDLQVRIPPISAQSHQHPQRRSRADPKMFHPDGLELTMTSKQVAWSAVIVSSISTSPGIVPGNCNRGLTTRRRE